MFLVSLYGLVLWFVLQFNLNHDNLVWCACDHHLELFQWVSIVLMILKLYKPHYRMIGTNGLGVFCYVNVHRKFWSMIQHLVENGYIHDVPNQYNERNTNRNRMELIPWIYQFWQGLPILVHAFYQFLSERQNVVIVPTLHIS